MTSRSMPRPQAAGGGHAVLEGFDVVPVEAVRLVVAAFAGPELLAESLGLVVGVVQLREGVRDLHAADEELESLGEPGVSGLVLGEGGDLDRVVVDEGGLNQLRFDQAVEQGHQQVAVGGVLRQVFAETSEFGGECRFVVDRGRVQATDVQQGLPHAQSRPGSLEVDLVAAPGAGCRAVGMHGIQDRGEHLLGEGHQLLVVGVGPVELEHRELGVVLGGDALVSEVAVDFEHTVQTADQQALEVELGARCAGRGRGRGRCGGSRTAAPSRPREPPASSAFRPRESPRPAGRRGGRRSPGSGRRSAASTRRSSGGRGSGAGNALPGRPGRATFRAAAGSLSPAGRGGRPRSSVRRCGCGSALAVGEHVVADVELREQPPAVLADVVAAQEDLDASSRRRRRCRGRRPCRGCGGRERGREP